MDTNLARPAVVVRRIPERANHATVYWFTFTVERDRPPVASDNTPYVTASAPVIAEIVAIDPPPTLTPARRCQACGGPFQESMPLPTGRPWTLCTFCRRRRRLPELGDGRGPATDGQTTNDRQERGAGRARQARHRGGAAGSQDRPAAAQERRCIDCRRSIAHRAHQARRCERCAATRTRAGIEGR